MPYRIDIAFPLPNAIEILIGLGALDIESVNDGLAAIMPDSLTQDKVVSVLGVASIKFSAAIARDNSSVWLLSPRTIRIGKVTIASPSATALPGALKLIDSPAFGTGHHPTTALCIEAIEEILTHEHLDSILDVGTGSGILALTALAMGVPQAIGLDIDADALEVAAENARLNDFADRLELILGGPDVVHGRWPLVVANVLAAPLIDMAPLLARRVGRRGRLILSGVPSSLESEVKRAYQHCGIGHIKSTSRAGWTMLIAQASS